MTSVQQPPHDPSGSKLGGHVSDTPLQPSIQTTTHLVSIPNRSFLQQGGAAAAQTPDPLAPHNSHFVVNIIHLRDSLAVWVGSASKDVIERAQKQKRRHESKEANKIRDDDDALDQELADALRAAGRLEEGPESGSSLPLPPLGALATEWAVAMSRPGQTAPLGTSLFRTNADVALPMSQRLAARLKIAQLFISLDLPPSLVSTAATAMVPDPPGRAQKMLMLERGIADSIRAGVKIVQEREKKVSS